MMSLLCRRAILSLPAALALGGRGWAQTAPTAPTPDLPAQIAKAAVAPILPSTSRLLKQRMEEWIAASPFANRDGIDLMVLRGRATIPVPPTNPDWVRFRMLAYQAAVLDAQAEYAGRQGEDTVSRAVKDFLKGPDAPPPYRETRSPDQAAEVIRKALAVAGGTLDQTLKEQGIDPKQYERATEPQKTELLRDHLKIQVVRQARARLVGVIPVKSFEAQDGAGTYGIGVVMIASPKIQDFAEQVGKARGDFVADPGSAQDLAAVYKDADQLLQDFGVRRMFDSQGLPVIVSFAQWGSSYRGTDRVFAAKFEEAAESQAEALADGQIADFLAASLNLSSDASAGQEVDLLAHSLPNEDWKPQEVKKIVDEQNKLIKRVANIRLVGVRTLYSWTGKHPDSETPIIGIIRMWSAAGERSIRARQAVPASAPAVDVPPNQINKVPGVTQGRDLMKASDF
jgi:hypothetical protein